MKKYLLVNAKRGDIAIQTAETDGIKLLEYIKKSISAWYTNNGVQGNPQEICQQLPENLQQDFTKSDRNTSITYSKSDDMFIVHFDRINIASDDPDITLEIVPMEFVPDLKMDK